MTDEEFITGLEKLGAVESRAQPDGRVLAVLAPQPAPVPAGARGWRSC